MKTIYQTSMINTGSRKGVATSPDGSFQLKMVSPVEMGGDGASAGTNPEQLFAATYSSCFNGALEHILRQAKVDYESTTVTATVSLVADPSDNGFRIAAKLIISVRGITLEQAQKYALLAHKFCPYSKAIQGNVDVQLEVV